jgi:hypothetical protein
MSDTLYINHSVNIITAYLNDINHQNYVQFPMSTSLLPEHECIYTFHVFTINDAITIATGYVEFYLAKEYKRILSRKIGCIIINKIQRSINVIHMKYKIIKYINC